MSDFAELLSRFTDAACRGDGDGVADCFTEDGVYHDVFYGAFRGRDELKDMIENRFHRDGEAFRWDMRDIVESNDRGYARYLFSYRSRKAGADARRSVFEGVVIARLESGLIAEYDELANPCTGLALMGLADERIAGFAKKQTEALRARPEAARHFA